MSKLVELSYPELKRRADNAYNQYEMVKYSVALITKFLYGIDVRRKEEIEELLIKIDKILKSDKEEKVKENLRQLKPKLLKLLEEVNKDIEGYI